MNEILFFAIQLVVVSRFPLAMSKHLVQDQPLVYALHAVPKLVKLDNNNNLTHNHTQEER